MRSNDVVAAVEFAHDVENPGLAGARRGRVRVAPQHVVVVRQRAIGFAAVDQRRAEAGRRVHVIRVAAQRLAVFAFGIGRIADLAKGVRQTDVRLGKIHVGFDRGTETCNRVVEPADPQERDAQVVVRARIAGGFHGRPAAAPLRLVVPAEREQGATHAVERLDVGRVELERALEALTRLVRLLGSLICEPQIVVINRIASIGGDGARQVVDRGLRGAVLAGQHAEEMERARVFWMCGENFVVKPLGFIESAGEVMVGRRLEIAAEWALVGRPGAARRSSVRHREAPVAVRRLP